jgi:hypothetical protein
VHAPLNPVAIARLDALVQQQVIARRPAPNEFEVARYLAHAAEDFDDASNSRIYLRGRFRIACNVSFASVDALLAAYAFVPPTNRRYYPNVLDVIFDNTPAAALAADMADVVARRKTVQGSHGCEISTATLSRYLEIGVNVNKTERLQLRALRTCNMDHTGIIDAHDALTHSP